MTIDDILDEAIRGDGHCIEMSRAELYLLCTKVRSAALLEAGAIWWTWKRTLQTESFTHSDGLRFVQALVAADTGNADPAIGKSVEGSQPIGSATESISSFLAVPRQERT